MLATTSGAPLPKTNSVLPPPTSMTRNGARPVMPPIAPSNPSTASSSPVITSGRAPRAASARSRNSSRSPAARTAAVATIRKRGHPGPEKGGPVGGEHLQRASDPGLAQAPGAIHPRPQAGHHHPPLQGLHPAPHHIGDEQAGRVGADVPGGDPHFGSRQRELVTARPDTSTTQASAQSSGSTQAATASPTGLSLPAAWSA